MPPLTALLLAGALLLGGPGVGPPPGGAPGPAPGAPVAPAGAVLQQPGTPGPGGVPAFVAQRGQWAEGPSFAVRRGPLTVWCEDDGWLVDVRESGDGDGDGRLRGAAVRLRFVDGDPAALPLGEDLLPGRRHVLRGADPGAWVRDIPAFAQVRWPDLHPGLDVVLRGEDDSVAFEALLAPGADPRRLVLACEGAEGLEIDEEGGLLIRTALATLRHPAPVTWQTDGEGRRRPVSSRWALLDAERVGFALGEHDPDLPLVIDPALQWATFLGSGGLDQAHALAVSPDGSVTLAGYTSAPSYPLTLGAYDTSANGQRDGFITRLAADGETLLFSTLLGGAADEEILALALDGSGGVVLGGWTASADFPPAPGSSSGTFSGGGALLGSDAFVARLDGQGSHLQLCRLLGGGEDDIAYAVAWDGSGLLVAGKTASADFPVDPAAFDGSYGGGSAAVGDAFAARVQADGVLHWSTFLGGSADDLAGTLLAGDDGSLTVAGWTASSDFPTTPGAHDRTLGGTSDAWVLTLEPGGSALRAATLVGGGSDENGLALARDPQGRVLLAGSSRSADLPVGAGALQPTFGGGFFYGDGFVARLAGDLSQLQRLTYLGGSGEDVATTVRAGPGGCVLVGGWTGSPDLALSSDALQPLPGGGNDGFLASLDLDGGTLLYGSYLGGQGHDRVNDLGLAAGGQLVGAGMTASADFPVGGGAWDATFGGGAGGGDAFVACFDLGLGVVASADWRDLGQGLAGAGGEPRLVATGSLAAGGGGQLLLDQAAAWAQVLLMVGGEAQAVPLAGGLLVPWPLLDVLVLGTGLDGELVVPYGPPEGFPPGTTFVLQAWVADGGAPQGWAASNALQAVLP